MQLSPEEKNPGPGRSLWFPCCPQPRCRQATWIPGASAPSSEVGPTTVPRVGQRKEDQNFQTKALAVLAGLGMYLQAQGGRIRNLESGSTGDKAPQDPSRGNRDRVADTYLPHQVVVLADVHVLRGDDAASEGAHLRARLDPRLGEDAEALAGDGTLRDDHLRRQHQAGQLLHLCDRHRGQGDWVRA